MTAATILGGETAATFDKMSDSISKVKAADVAAEKMNNFKGSLEQLKGSLETFMITAGTPLLKTLKNLVDGLTGFVNKLLELPPGVLNVGIKVAAFSSGLLIAVGTIMKIIGAIARFKTALETLGIIQKVASWIPKIGVALEAIGTAATGPIGIAIAAVVAIGVALYELYKHNPKFKAFVDKLWADIKNIALMAFDQLKLGVQALVDGFNGVTSATGFVGFLQDVGGAARTLWDALKNLWEVWKTTIWPILKDGASQVWQALKDAWVQMKPALSDLWAALKELWNAMEPDPQTLGRNTARGPQARGRVPAVVSQDESGHDRCVDQLDSGDHGEARSSDQVRDRCGHQHDQHLGSDHYQDHRGDQLVRQARYRNC
jgi:hypothetical protein